MEILSARRAPPGTAALCFANVKVSDDVSLFNIKITEKGGRYFAYAANAQGVRTATISPRLADEIARAAIASIGAFADAPR